ncbi:hypothetical protein FOZ62_010122, partial [Perkinsus olseni]
DHHCTVCMPYLPCPAVPTKYKPKRDGSLPICFIPCQEDPDCQEGAVCIPTTKTSLCAFNETRS